MRSKKENLITLIIFVLVVAFTTLILMFIFPGAKAMVNEINNEDAVILQDMKSIAIGDSLTEGVGDSTDSGGYVPLLKKDLLETNKFASFEISNRGKSGNTTDQLVNRINKSADIQEEIKNADMIFITIGSNDLMKVVRSNILNQATIDMFDKPKEKYISDLTELYSLLRSLNKDAIIYQLGIYNPYYEVFEEITQLQLIVDDWNKATESILSEDKKAYFVPISEQMQDSDSTVNSLLSEDDHFHPNDIGYRVIAKAFFDKIMETEETWK